MFGRGVLIAVDLGVRVGNRFDRFLHRLGQLRDAEEFHVDFFDRIFGDALVCLIERAGEQRRSEIGRDECFDAAPRPERGGNHDEQRGERHRKDLPAAMPGTVRRNRHDVLLE